jgi:NADH:ubiquinone reductase (H+-translocating)
MKIAITGGGFAGLSAAMSLDKTLARRADVDITLVSRENFVLFTPMLDEVEQLVTVRDVDAVTRQLERMRAREGRLTGTAAP